MISTRTVTNHTSAVRYLVARRAECLTLADQNTELAAKFLANGDVDAAGELIAVAQDYMAQVARIDACKAA